MKTDSPEKRAIDVLVSEAKEDLVPRDVDIHWGRVEEKVMARVAFDPAPLSSEVKRRGGAMRWAAVGLAAAAAAALVVRRDRDVSLDTRPLIAQVETQSGGALRSTEGAGEVRIGGAVASAGHLLHAGDAIEAEGARAVVERPGKVTWLLEHDVAGRVARAAVKSTGESLVLSLDDGAVEAQVVPVPSGEAFAVDVASGGKLVRVAVHGTHLRVTRQGRRLSVDLTEGVVSIGVPPRTGVTYGTLVTAPAHVELDVEDLDGSLRVDHAEARVRAPIPLGSREVSAAAAAATPAEPESTPAAASPHAKHDPPKASSATPRPSARDAIAAAVRACAAARKPAPGDVHGTVSSRLELKVGPSGEVQAAVFDPPLMPEIQSCAAETIYKTRFADDETGSVVVPIEFRF